MGRRSGSNDLPPIATGSAGSKPYESADVGDFVQLGNHLAELACSRRAEHRHDQAVKFRGKALFLPGDIGRGYAGIMARGDAPSVNQLEFHLTQSLWPVVLPIEFHPLA